MKRLFVTLIAVLGACSIATTYAATCDDSTPERTLCAVDSDCEARTSCQFVGCRGGMCAVVGRAPSGTPCEGGGTCNAGLCCR